jgi:hypothetical protein
MKKTNVLITLITGVISLLLVGVLFSMQLVETAVAEGQDAVLARTPTPTKKGSKKTPTPKKTARATATRVYPTWTPTSPPAPQQPTQPPVATTEAVPPTDSPQAPGEVTPVLPQSVFLQICVLGACKDFEVPQNCDPTGTCDGSSSVPAENCGTAEDCQASIQLTCVGTDANSSQCKGNIDIMACGTSDHCSQPLEFPCSNTDCSPTIAVNIDSAAPTYTPTVAPTNTPASPISSLTSNSSLPLLLGLLCLVAAVVGMVATGAGGYFLGRMSANKGGEEE